MLAWRPCRALLENNLINVHLLGVLFVLKPVPTPCVGVCSTGIGGQVCRGCKRFAHEVIDWNGYNQRQRYIITQRLEVLLTQVVEAKIVIKDVDLLRQQLDYQRIRFNADQNPHCWVFELLKAGARQISDLSVYGLARTPLWRDQPLLAIREAIDTDYFTLSCAHYERYIAPGMTAAPE